MEEALLCWGCWRGFTTGAGHPTTNRVLCLAGWEVSSPGPPSCHGHRPCHPHHHQDELLGLTFFFFSARCWLKAIEGGPAKHTILCHPLLFIAAIWFHCTSIQGGAGGLYRGKKMMPQLCWIQLQPLALLNSVQDEGTKGSIQGAQGIHQIPSNPDILGPVVHHVGVAGDEWIRNWGHGCTFYRGSTRQA